MTTNDLNKSEIKPTVCAPICEFPSNTRAMVNELKKYYLYETYAGKNELLTC